MWLGSSGGKVWWSGVPQEVSLVKFSVEKQQFSLILRHIEAMMFIFVAERRSWNSFLVDTSGILDCCFIEFWHWVFLEVSSTSFT